MMSHHTKIVAVISALLFFGALFFLVGIIYAIDTSEQKLIEQKTEIAKMQAHANELNALARLVDASREERELLSQYVLQEENVIDFLSLVELIARRSGIEITIANLTVVHMDEVFETVQMNIAVSGPKQAVFSFLNILETLPYQAHVSSATLDGGGGSDSSLWRGQFTLGVTKEKQHD